jgi:pimeloyl-ACP methyl ester carboxylesterase
MAASQPVSLAVSDLGAGAAIVLLPSLGRSSADFEDLQQRLVDAGHRAIAVDPRGVGDSGGSLDGLNLHDLAADVAAVIESSGAAPAVVAGHAFGNRVARCLAADRGELVRGVVLLAAGGRVHPSDEVLAAMVRVLDETTPADEHLSSVASVFFAPGNDASVWRDGWWRATARAQSAATRATPIDDWWDAGCAPVLVVQGLDDAIAVPENGRQLRAAFPDRVTLVELADAGHALLPEQPDGVAAAVLAWLATLP